MSHGAAGWSERAAELRRAFDRTFAEGATTAGVEVADLLVVKVGGDPYAIRVGEIAGLHADVSVTPLPSPLAELLGIAFLRGAIVPIYDLRVLLGYPAGAPPRWLVFHGASKRVGFAFDELEGHRRAAQDAITPVGTTARPGRRHVSHVVAIDDVVRPILHLPSALEQIEARASPGLSKKER